MSRSASPASLIRPRTASEQRVVDELAGRLALLVEVEHLDQVGSLARELLVAHGVDVELVAGDVLVLGALGRLEVDDRDLVACRGAG